jgi:hypothetical protein
MLVGRLARQPLCAHREVAAGTATGCLARRCSTRAEDALGDPNNHEVGTPGELCICWVGSCALVVVAFAASTRLE